MSQKDLPEATPRSPLAAAVLGANVQLRQPLARTPWRQRFEQCLLESIAAGNRSLIGLRLDSIERITRPNDEYILSHLCSVLESRIAPLGEDAAFYFLDAMWSVSVRAKAVAKDPEQAGNLIMAAADRLGFIAESLSEEKAFSAICRGMERIKDFGVLSNYLFHFMEMSGKLRNAHNPEGTLKNLDTIRFHAAFIAERSDGSNHERVGEILSVLSKTHSAFDSAVVPLGEEAALAFINTVLATYDLAKAESRKPEDATSKLSMPAEKLGSIAENVSNGRVFSLICRGAEKIADLKVRLKYINYMFALSSHVRSERNPGGPIKDLQMPAFHATFIAERSEGSNSEYVDNLLTKLLAKLNDVISGAEPQSR